MKLKISVMLVSATLAMSGCAGGIVGSMQDARAKGPLVSLQSNKSPEAVAGCIAPAWSALQHNLDSYEAVAQPRAEGGFTVKTLRLPDAADVYPSKGVTKVDYFNIATNQEQKWPRNRIAAIKSCL